MSIQISITIWTILCFCTLMPILQKLLFRPVLKVLDARREKLHLAEERKKAALTARDAEKKAAHDAREKAMQEAAWAAATAAVEAKETMQRRVAAQRVEYALKLEEERQQLQRSLEDAARRLEGETAEISKSYARRLTQTATAR